MNISETVEYLHGLQLLIIKQQAELDKTRNLLGRALDANGGKILTPRKVFDIGYDVTFSTCSESANIISISTKILPAPFKSDYEQILQLKKELNL